MHAAVCHAGSFRGRATGTAARHSNRDVCAARVFDAAGSAGTPAQCSSHSVAYPCRVWLQKEIVELRRGFEQQRRQIEYMASEACSMAMLRAAMALRQDEMRKEWRRDMNEVRC